MDSERDPLTKALLNERDPLTPALLQERPRRYRKSGIFAMPVSSAPRATPSRPARTDRQIRAIARNRIWATTDAPISAEAAAETLIILTVLADRRRRKDFTGWHLEAQEYIDLVIPNRRQLLEGYAHFRALIRRHRRSWILAEHITDLDDTLDRFP